ncbi:glycosyltransferase family 4 protein [Mesorhizobium sp. SB112]|uniref:glycosyltransferase family 4 protein n=1 Tax=Mesorhizobium sp. SB112 TaxID=3151853 RepID=UPI00326325A0
MNAYLAADQAKRPEERSRAFPLSLRPMKIAHLISHKSQNGVATSLKELIDAQLRAGHQIMLVHRPKSWIQAQSFAGSVKMVEARFSMKPGDLRKTGYAIRDWGRTIVHAHGSPANKTLMIFRIADGVPSVMTAHLRHFQLPWRAAHAVIGLNKKTADYYTLRKLVPTERMYVLSNLFDASQIAPVTESSRMAARATLGIRNEAFVLGSIGQISDRKNQVDILRLLKKLVLEGLDADLLLIGHLSENKQPMPGWNAMLADPAIAGRVHLAGHRNDAVKLLHAMDVFVCTSRREEAPIAPVEAMAVEIPVLSTKVGNMDELLAPASLFEIGDMDGMGRAVSRLAADEAMRRAKGAAARRMVVEKLAPEAVQPKMDEVYFDALERARDRGRRYFKDPADLRW